MRTRLFLFLFVLLSVVTFGAPYLGQTQPFSQPDGTSVEVKLFGDEYYMRGESTSGYTVIRDEKTGWICYAQLSADGTKLVSSDIHYTSEKDVPQLITSSIGQHIDLTTSNRNMAVQQNRTQLKADDFERNFTRKQDYLKSLTLSSPRNVKALTIVVDFSDQPATLTKADFESFCNDMNYTAFGNNGSIKRFFSDISGGLLVYDNVVFGIYRAPKTFAQYEAMPYADGAQEILASALTWINNQGFNFSTLTINSDGQIQAINLMYTGTPKTWAQGMWYHSGWYTNFSADGVSSGRYNCSPANSPLALGTACHENGHMICDWPDTYKYDSNNGTDGIGWFDLMCGGAFGGNPSPPNPYFIYTAGWANITDVNGFSGVKTDVASSNRDFYRYVNPSNSKEYYLFKNYQKTGRTTNCPDAGLTIWHIDEAGDNQTTHHQVYLEHANNNKDLHAGACWRSDRNSAFDDTTAPNAKWYSGSTSSLKVSNISGIGSTMNYQFGVTGTVVTNPAVTFYQDCNYGGSAIGFKTGDYTTSSMTNSGLSDNYASSIKVVNGYKVDIYKDDNFSGATTTITSDNSCLTAVGFNDVMSSFKIRTNGTTTLNGGYRIKNRVSGKFLQILNASLDNGGNVIQWSNDGSNNQKWQLTHLGDGVYSIINKNSGKALDISEVSTADGALVHQWAYLGNDNQKFIIQESNPGFYQLIALHSNKVVEVGNASTADGAALQQWTDNNQQWSEWVLVSDIPTPLAAFISNKTDNCSGAIQFTDQSSNTTSWLWSFGDGITSTDQNPLHNYTNNGVYSVSLTATNINGSNVVTKNNLITINNITNPVTSDKTICSGNTAILTATGSNNILWYKTASDVTPIATGTSYTTDPLTQTTTYYVANAVGGVATSVGAADTLIGSGVKYPYDTHGLLFNVLKEITLQSVKVYSFTNGDRTIQLLDAVNGNVLQTKTVNVPVGYQRITLDFNIQPGNQYFLKCSGLVDFYRNSTGAKFPYTINDLVSITQTDLDPTLYPAYYYFFYDWKVVEVGCSSSLVPVKVNVNPLPTKPSLVQTVNNLSVNPINANYSYQWYYNGNAINGATVANYAFSASGLYKVEAKLNGCTTESNQSNVIFTGPNDLAIDGFTLYPNPADKLVNLSFGNTTLKDVKISVYNMAGETIYTNTANANGSIEINVTNYANGVYFCELRSGMVVLKRKFVVKH